MPSQSNLFTAQMIAPCGLDCSICIQAHAETDPCPGCNGPDQCKPEFCSTYCSIVQCENRRNNGWQYCNACPDYPCGDVLEKENRYTTQYPLRESPLENLKCIQESGMENFLKKEREQWTCQNCGGVICVMTGKCSSCGKKG